MANILPTDICKLDPQVKVLNVNITPSNREYYRYVIVREWNDDLWFYAFANSLSMATRICREIENGVVLAIENCK